MLEANYLPVYRFELPCEDLDHLDQGLRYHILGVKILPRFFNDLLEKQNRENLFQCRPVSVYLCLSAASAPNSVYHSPVAVERYRETALKNCFQAFL